MIGLLRKGKPLRLGDTYKNTHDISVCDLRGLAEGLGPGAREHDFKLAVGASLKAARARRLVKAVVDRRDAWTAIPDILGNIRDKTYMKIKEERLGDGGWAMTLRKRKPGKATRRPVSPPDPLPKADVVIYRVMRSRDQVGVWEAKVRVGRGQPRWISLHWGTVNAGGVAAIVAELLEPHPGQTVAVAAIPEVVGLVVPRENGRSLDRLVLVPLKLAQERLLEGWTWEMVQGWLTGRRRPSKRISGPSIPRR